MHTGVPIALLSRSICSKVRFETHLTHLFICHCVLYLYQTLRHLKCIVSWVVSVEHDGDFATKLRHEGKSFQQCEKTDFHLF